MSKPASDLISYSFAKTMGVVALGDLDEDSLTLGVRQGASKEAILEARRVIGVPLIIKKMSHAVFDKALMQVYTHNGLASSASAISEQGNLYALAEDIPQTEDLLDNNDDAPVIRLINGLIQEAIKLNASDIHVEPHENRLSVRFRVDGVLREVLSLAANLASVLVSRIKVMARLDIAKKRIPQDGRFSLNLGVQAIDVRVSTLPSKYGERAVLRILNKEQALFSVSELGMTRNMTARFTKALSAPNGIVLVTGPTGSGKTTTLYAGLSMLNESSRNILTVEDPIEYALDGIGQTGVDVKSGMSFAAGLRAILRQDPDVVMVGEIRDSETAKIAVQAALTGHLVLSTVHTNSAAAAITRLRDMGIEPYLLASTISTVVAQRLVRRLCGQCKQKYVPDIGIKRALGLDGNLVFCEPNGCEACHNIGYSGRVGLYEMIEIDDKIRKMIHDGAREQEIAKYAFQNSDTLLQSGARLVADGIADAREVLRVCQQLEAEADNSRLAVSGNTNATL